MAEKLGHPYRAATLLTLFLKFTLWELHVEATCFHVRVSFDETSQNQHPQGGPFPIPKLGLGNFNYMWIEMLVRSVYT